MWAYPQTNLATLQTLSSSCFSLCLSLYTRAARRDRFPARIDQRNARGGCRRITGLRNIDEERGGGGGNMEDALSTMPLVLQQPERGDEEMDPRVWKGLPNELQDRVLACLPVPLLLQFRLVCKRWRDVIVSPAFTKLRAEAPHCGPHFLIFEFHKPESLAAYDPWLERWHFCPPPSVPFLKAEVMSVCADGGLLCVVMRRTWFAGPASILLCNPVTRTYKELPETSIDTELSARGRLWKPILVALVVDQASNSFRVIAAGSSTCPHNWMHSRTCLCRVTEVYDSRTNKWEMAGYFPWVDNEPGYFSRRHAVCGENLYCVEFGEDGYNDLMMVFNLKRMEWTKSPVLLPHLEGEHILLFERRGALVLVQRVEKNHGLPAVHTWRPSTNEWKLVPTLLPRNGRKFEELFHFDDDLFWVGQGDHLFFVSPKWDQAVMYDISRKKWTITPQSRFLRQHCQSVLPLPFDFNLRVQSADSISGQSWLKY
ncbi:hypothetical protein MPTK1_8g02540 [Marchantia polymorpha subsp. ruderalis]|uniref:F-box domain-containing protein n=1 Tax=Marchantia polymorpha TaxID=3197 RepID=A0A2R6XJ10_MARPO|nr:hypothetical protein MARPO_0012s0051 [Marchantia polymorpha]BBN18446.1 hypothetical protein Mp_8g02540 [Marchantia polymorpha subsp. ruderalis]|eukprot:PTQ46093.1 hypothetical protein MARPO_0012s0051 [Marchantia polymorpha]